MLSRTEKNKTTRKKIDREEKHEKKSTADTHDFFNF